MINSVLIIVPHQDDELNIAGFILDKIIKEGIKVNILYVTRGDFYNKYEARQRERDNALKVYGNIYYRQLDYPDSYKADNHIFNDKIKRNTVERDIKQYIKEVLADMIICVDYDSHADHRMVSSIFDQVMKELILEENYKPIVLKKFAYLGVWDGENDYFNTGSLETKPRIANSNIDDTYFLCSPNDWDDRIRISVDSKEYGLAFWKSKAFKAYCKYFTQCGFRFFFRAANSDAVYWYRNTSNIMLKAKISASSGDVRFLNDFALGNVDGICEDFEGENKFKMSAWIPDEDDQTKKFVAEWSESITIEAIKVYQNFRYEGHISSFKLKLNNGFNRVIECNDEDVIHIHIPRQENVSVLEVQIIESEGNAGIREFEIYENEGCFPWSEIPFQEYHAEEEMSRKNIKIYEFVAYIYWCVLRGINKIRKHIGKTCW